MVVRIFIDVLGLPIDSFEVVRILGMVPARRQLPAARSALSFAFQLRKHQTDFSTWVGIVLAS